jgi:hypothetical protein
MTVQDVAADPALTGEPTGTRPPSPSSLLVPVALFIALSAADAVISACLLSLGLMREANPIMRLALAHLGLVGVVSVKLTLAALAASLLKASYPGLPHIAPGVAWTANALYLLLWGCGFLAMNLGPFVPIAA